MQQLCMATHGKASDLRLDINALECGACRMNCPRHAIEVTQGVGCVTAIVNGMRKSGGGCECSTGGREPTACG
jgi:hypothetical protein